MKKLIMVLVLLVSSVLLSNEYICTFSGSYKDNLHYTTVCVYQCPVGVYKAESAFGRCPNRIKLRCYNNYCSVYY